MNTESKAALHEPATIRAFVLPHRQERFLVFLAKPRTRKKFIEDLNCFRWFDPRFVVPVKWKVDPNIKLSTGHVHSSANILRLLQSRGAGRTCWVMSEDENLDGREVGLEWVLEEVFGSQMGTIVSCIPGKLALYVWESEILLLNR